MRKLILILITGLFLSNTSYGASISELLGNKKSIKLSCVINKYSNRDIDNPSDKGKVDIRNVNKLFIVVEKELFSINFGGSQTEKHDLNITSSYITNGPIEREIVISDESIELKYLENVIGENRTKYRDYESIEVSINRYTGDLVYSERLWSWGMDVHIRGNCTKAGDKKF